MSIFAALKNAIFGTRPQTPLGQPPQAPASPGAPISSTATTVTATPGPRPGAQVDIAEVLNAKAASKHEKLNWRTSIVDLMKLVDLDPSLDNRKALASELGYTGDTKDTASMNVWLHQRVMKELAASGGKVPDDLLRH
jgi:Domain of unknown function (DUF3597)